MDPYIIGIGPRQALYTDTSPSLRAFSGCLELIKDRALPSEKYNKYFATQPNKDYTIYMSDYYAYDYDKLMWLGAVNVLYGTSYQSDILDYYIEPIEVSSDDFVDTTELTDALDDLNKAIEEALEEGLPIPSDIAIRNSEKLVKIIYEVFPSRFEVYPTQDGEIAVEIYNGKGSSVILLCDSAGKTLCMVNINGNSRRAHYSQIDQLPDGFVKEALYELSV